MSFKIGDRVKVLEKGCQYGGEQAVVTRVEEATISGRLDTVYFKTDCGQTCYEPSDEFELLTLTWEGLKAGDQLRCGNESRTVLGVADNMVAVSMPHAQATFGGWYTKKQLQEDWTIVGPGTPETELTLQDVADKFNIDVKTLRIKEQS